MKDFDLAPPAMQRLRDGTSSRWTKYTFIQRIPRSHYVWPSGRCLSLLPAPDAPAGSRPAGLYCHLARFPCIHLDATALAGHAETGIRRTAFWEGHLTERIHFDSGSSFDRLGIAFNQMADNINALIASKKQLIDGIAHELRTPLVRLRYRPEMSENLTGAESQALNRDIGQLEALIEELLTYARLDRPQTELHLSTPDLPVWLQTHINDVQSVNPQRKLLTAITPARTAHWTCA